MNQASKERIVRLLRQHGKDLMLHQANEILQKEGLFASKSRFYYVKKTLDRYQQPEEHWTMHEKLDEFYTVLTESLDLLSPKLRPSIQVKDGYEPHNGPDLPVQALIIGGRWAAFVQMWDTKPPTPSVRIEDIKPEATEHKRDDPSLVTDSPNPYSICGLLLQVIVGDYFFPLRSQYNKKMFPK